MSGQQGYSRPLRKPVFGTVVVAVAGDPKLDSLEFAVNPETGEVTEAASRTDAMKTRLAEKAASSS